MIDSLNSVPPATADATAARERKLADLEAALRLAGLGSWSWAPRSGEMSWSPQMFAMFGREPALGAASGERFFECVHPDDRERVADAYAQALGGGPGFEFDYRIVGTGDGERTVHAIGREDPARPGWFVGTVQDVGEQRRAQRELVEASVRAEAANRSKSEFLARMSHQLRTPLNSIIGFGQLLELERLPPRERGHVAFILKEARHLLELINAVLDLAEIESGQISIAAEPVALADALGYALALVAPLGRENDVRVHLTPDGLTGGHVIADRQRLGQVLLNLLSNAIKYNRPGGTVDVSCVNTDAGRVRTTIADTGIGVEPEQLAKLFEPFERLGAERIGVEGAGLGLTLARGLIEAMGGTIEVSSRRDAGTMVVFELKAAERPGVDTRATTRGGESGALDSAAGERARIIYIEDNISNLTLVARILDRYRGVELIPAMQATIGLELAREHPPDLIVLDLHLPDMPGTDALTRLRREHPEVPVVVLTADARDGQEQRMRELGAADYLTKPLDVDHFVNVLDAHLSAHTNQGT